jgi:AGZA family xanthine/uracil permease-like MFS transporter
LSIPLMFSIAEGIGLGLIAAAVLALGTGAPRRLNAVGYVLAAIFLAQFLHLGPFR